MADCSICNGCYSRRRELILPSYGFSKKLLVATCILAIIMCLTESEAAPTAHKKHKKSQSQGITKLTKEQTPEHETEFHARHRRRHQRHQTKTKDPLHKIYVSKMDNIVRKLGETLENFNKNWRNVNESSMYRDNKRKFKLPSTNYTEILFDIRNQDKSNSTLVERKFKYLLPKLYQSLTSYHEIFEFLLRIETTAVDVDFSRYLDRRNKSFNEIVDKIYSIKEEIRIYLENVSIPIPVNDNTVYLENFKTKANEGECFKYDGTVLKSYSNFLNRWFCIITNSKNISPKQNRRCLKFQKNLKNKRRQHRKQKIRKRTTRMLLERRNI
ncbi:uncharacterized protein LOC113509774 isoform X1 [Galleria mellonella]|uniref:Uncharacterized protein LOC113509774 isoform X1 n=1 Tax=Galleria mellonella TaxID=7137 RepID=A0A6J1W834_GALME|nr:uncharacterized protein LOC113509774 isoform X1 [Galleria mellonella]